MKPPPAQHHHACFPQAPGPPAWRKSSHSGYNGNCVEVADLGPTIGVRDSKNPGGPVLQFTRSDWATFLARISGTR